MNTYKYERKKELLNFLLAKPIDQPKLFNIIINKHLIKIKEYMDKRSNNEELTVQNKMLDNMIYKGKIDMIKYQTKVLEEQIKSHANGIKYPSHLSIIERKLFIIELQLDVGVYNILNKTLDN